MIKLKKINIYSWSQWLAILGFIVFVGWILWNTGLHPRLIYAQSTAQDLCLARWEWVADDTGFEAWTPPFNINNLGMVDLRSQTEKAIPGPGTGGWGLFSYDHAMGSTGMSCYGANLDRALTAAQVNTLALVVGLQMGDLTATNMRQAITQLKVNYGDPTGATQWKPARMSKDGLNIQLGGFGTIYTEPLNKSSISFRNTLNVRFADYRRRKASGEALESLRRWTGADMLRLYSRYDPALESDLIPPEYLNDGSVRPGTTYTDAFTDSDSTSLDAHTSDDGGSWTEIIGTGLDIQSNQGHASDAAEDAGRLDLDLSSDAMSTQAYTDISNDTSNDPKSGVTARNAAAAVTFVVGEARQSTTFAFRIYEFVAGTPSLLNTCADTPAPTDGTMLLDVDGADNVTLYWDAVSKCTTSTSVTGNVRGGIYKTSSISRTTLFDDLVVTDGISAGGARRIIAIQ